MKTKLLYIPVFVLLIYFPAAAQLMSLQQVIDLALKQSPDAVLAKTNYKKGYWQYRTYKSNYLPLLSANTSIPSFERSIVPVPELNGETVYVPSAQLNNTAGISLSQPLGITGGTIALNSGLSRVDYLNNSGTPTSYITTPVSLSLQQPLFNFNPLYWSKRIEPLKYDETKKQYAQDVEDIRIKATTLYFNVLASKTAVDIAQKNKDNGDSLLHISQGRFELGKIAENDLLQIKFEYLNAKLAVQQSSIDLLAAENTLKSFLGMGKQEKIDLTPPIELDTLDINADNAWKIAQNNSIRGITFSREALEANRDVHQAIEQNGVTGTMNVQYGLTNQANNIAPAYTNPQDLEIVTIGLSIPILDWGRARGQIQTAKAQQEYVQASIKQAQNDFEQEVYARVNNYNLQKTQVAIAYTASDVALRRYNIAKQRYLIGKISVTDLNVAQNDRDAAERAYIEALRNFWIDYYSLRKSTLYDFRLNLPLDAMLPGVN